MSIRWMRHRMRRGITAALALALIAAGMLASAQTAFASGWSSANSLPVPLQNHAAFTDGTYLYVAGGLDNTFQLGTYSAPVSSTGVVGPWKTLPSIPQALINHAAVEQGGFAVLLGGWNSSGAQATVYSAQLQSGGGLGSWTGTTSLPQPLYDLAAVSSGGLVWTLGGFGSDGRARQVVYVAAQNGGAIGAWSKTTPLPQGSGELGAALANGYIYVAGGRAGKTTLATVYSAPIGSGGMLGAWTALPSLPLPLFDPGVTAAGGYLWVIGGYTWTGTGSPTKTNGVYRAPLLPGGAIGAWQSVAPLPGHVAEHTLTVVNGYLIVAGSKVGQNGASAAIFDAPVTGL